MDTRHDSHATGQWMRRFVSALSTVLVVGCGADTGARDEVVNSESYSAEHQALKPSAASSSKVEVPSSEGNAVVDDTSEMNMTIEDHGDGNKPVPQSLGKAARGKLDRSTIPSDRKSNQSTGSKRQDDKLDESLRSSLAKAAPDEQVNIYVTLEDRPFDWGRFRRAKDDNELSLAIQDRRVDTSLVTSSLTKHLHKLSGSRIKQETWLVPGVEVTVNASEVEKIAGLPGVKRVSPATTEMKTEAEYTDGYSGLEARGGMRTDAFISAGFKGNGGGRAGGALRVGLLEHYWDSVTGKYDYMSWKHRGFVYCSGGSCWYRTTLTSCADGACQRDTNPDSGDTGTPIHSNTVMQIMAGSIESGSDSSITSTSGRVKRSGIAPRADLYYYVTEDWGNIKCTTAVAALEKAISDKIDVLDFSTGMGTCGCDRSCDTCGMNAAIANLREAGTLWVKSIGDAFDSSTCNITYPGQRRDGLTVAMLDTSSSTINYDTAVTRAASSRGGMDLRVNGSIKSKAVAVADLSAPGCWTYQYFYPPTNGYAANYVSGGNFGCGASFAAPAVAGAAALLRQQLNSIGLSGNNVGLLIANMLLMGDGYSFDDGGFKSSRFDSRSGAGRVHMHFPGGANLTAPWGWGHRAVTLADGDTATYTVGSSGAESSSITQWKGAMTWFEADYDDAADIVFRVIDTCNNDSLVAIDMSYDMRKRITLTQSSISNKCLSFKVSAFHIPAGQTRTVYLADYYHSGSTANH